jgi:uncharacterized protein involved in exopolysaccharide biosynthesis
MSADPNNADALDIGAGIDAIRREKLLFFGLVFLFTLAGVAHVAYTPRSYRAEVVMIQVDSKSLPGGLSQLSGLAGLAGVNLSRGENQQPMAVLRSKSLVSSFIDSNNLLPVLFSDHWNSKAGSWELNPADIPTIRDAVTTFDRDIREVSEDKKTGLVTLRIVWSDAATAADWANGLVKAANARLRLQALSDAQRNVDYLQRQVASTGVVSLQNSLGQLLESEMQKLLLARGNEEFAFKVIDAAVAPEEPYRPRKAVMLVIWFCVGLLVAGIAVYLKRRSTSVS